MKAVVLKKPKEIVVEEVPVPKPGYGQALVRVTYCGICGSDVYPMVPEQTAGTIIIPHSSQGKKDNLSLFDASPPEVPL